MSDVINKINEQISYLERQRERLHDEIARTMGRIEGLRDALAMVSGQTTTKALGRTTQSGSRLPDPSRSQLWAFALKTLEQAPQSGMSIDDLLTKARQHGVALQRNTLRSWLSHAYKEQIVRRVRMGVYALEGNAAPNAVAGNGGGGLAAPSKSEAPDESESSGASIESGMLPLNH